MVKSEIKKDKYERRIEKKKKSDLLVNRLMFEFVLGVIGIFGMLSVKKNSIYAIIAKIRYPLELISGFVLLLMNSFSVLAAKKRIGAKDRPSRSP